MQKVFGFAAEPALLIVLIEMTESSTFGQMIQSYPMCVYHKIPQLELENIVTWLFFEIIGCCQDVVCIIIYNFWLLVSGVRWLDDSSYSKCTWVSKPIISKGKHCWGKKLVWLYILQNIRKQTNEIVWVWQWEGFDYQTFYESNLQHCDLTLLPLQADDTIWGLLCRPKHLLTPQGRIH